MKRVLLIIIVCILCNIVWGGVNDIVYIDTPNGTHKIDTTLIKDSHLYIDKHLAHAISCINHGNFESAKDSLLKVNRWQFYSSDSICFIPRIIGNSHGFSRPDTLMHIYPYYIYTWDNCRIEIIHPQRMHQFIAFKERVPVPSYIWRNLLRYYRKQIYFLQNYIRSSNRDRSLFIYYYQELCWVYSELEEEDDVEYAKIIYKAGKDAYMYHFYYIASKYLEEAYDIGSYDSKKTNYSIYSALRLGDIYSKFGNYEKAEYYLNCALLNPHHKVTPIAHFLLGNLFLTLGDSRQAENHFKQSFQFAKKRKNYDVCLQSLYGLIYVYYYDKDFDNVDKCLKQLGKYHSYKKKNPLNENSTESIILSRNDISSQYAYAILIDLNDSTEHLEHKLELITTISNGAVEYIQHCNLLGLCFYKAGKYLQTMQYLNKARFRAEQAMRDREMGSHQEYAKTLSSLIQVYTAMGLPELAKPILWESAKQYKDRYLESLSFLTARQRDLYWDKIRPDFMNLYPAFEYRNYPQWPELAEIAYNNELFTKGLLLTSSEAIRRSVLSSGDTVLIAQWEELTAIRQAIKAMQERMTDMERIDEYEKRAEELEKIITVNSAAYRENMQQWSITWDSVRKALKPQQVAIEYMSAPINEDSTMYCALLLRDNCSQPILIPLFEQKEVDSLLERYTDTVYLAIQRIYAYDERGKALSERIWNNVKPYLHTGDTIYFSATGVLHQIAIENLWYDSTHTMADTYTMVRLSSTRELAIHRAPIQNETATLYGGIKYSAEAQTMVDVYNMQKYNTPAQEKFLAYNQTRGGLTHADPLTATQYEISATETILKGKHFHVDVLSGHMANEESFKHLSGQKKNILHIATHGFYTPDSTYQNPLERCGLLFAGANLFIDGNIQQVRDIDENVGDGIVTAKDISLMDLRGADIVVLSACETGLGDVTGEGVFGLQRAFKMAGAQTLIMSLWQVHDLSTQLLMTAFYRHWIEKGESKREAFRAAQQEVRNSGFESPYYWAGFILLD